jgi:hypothetical protein
MSFDEALNDPMPDEVDCGLDFDAGRATVYFFL